MSTFRNLAASVILSALLTGTAAAQGGWIQTYISGYLNAVAFPDPSRATAVGSGGLILQSTDGGESWTTRPGGTTQHLYAVAFRTPSDGIAVGDYGTTCRTTDGGATWVQQYTPLLAALFGLALSGDSLALAVGQAGNVFRSTDGGEGWTLLASPVAENLYAVSFFNAMIAVAVGGSSSGRVIRTTDGGTTWTEIELASSYPLHGVAANPAGLAIAVGGNGLVLRSTDFGLNWERGVSSTTNPLHAVALQGGDRATASGAGVLLSTSDGGQLWQAVYGFSSQGGLGIAFATPLLGISVGNNAVARTRSGGELYWTRQSSGTQRRLRGLCFVTPDIGVVVGDSGTILRTVDAGAAWLPVAAGTSVNLNAAGSFGPELMMTAGDAGILLKSTDTGISWEPLPIPAGARLRSLKLLPGGTGLVVGDSSALLRTTDFGGTWTRDTLSGWSFASVDMMGSYGYLLSDRLFFRACFRTTDAGISWNRVSTPEGLPSAVCMIHPDTAFVAGSPGILRTTDGGTTWVRVSSSVNGSALSMQFFDHGFGIVGRSTGVVSLSSDRGESWVAEPTGSSMAIRGVTFSGPNTVFAVGDSGVIFRRTLLPPVGVQESEEDPLPLKSFLGQNYPNPFNPSTEIGFQILDFGPVELSVFDVLGRKVATLVDGPLERGAHKVSFDGGHLPSGVYYYRLMVADRAETRAMVLLR